MHELTRLFDQVAHAETIRMTVKVVGVVVGAIVLRVVAHHTIGRIAERIAAGLPPLARQRLGRLEQRLPGSGLRTVSRFGQPPPELIE